MTADQLEELEKIIEAEYLKGYAQGKEDMLKEIRELLGV